MLAEYLDRAAEAENYVKQAYRLIPENPDLLDTYGWVLYKLGKQQEALACLARSVWLRESPYNRYHIAIVLAQLGRTSAAREQLRRALRKVGDDKDIENKIRSALDSLR